MVGGKPHLVQPRVSALLKSDFESHSSSSSSKGDAVVLCMTATNTNTPHTVVVIVIVIVIVFRIYYYFALLLLLFVEREIDRNTNKCLCVRLSSFLVVVVVVVAVAAVGHVSSVREEIHNEGSSTHRFSFRLMYTGPRFNPLVTVRMLFWDRSHVSNSAKTTSGDLPFDAFSCIIFMADVLERRSLHKGT